MTDVGPYTFGFLSQLTGISFPKGSYALFFTAAATNNGAIEEVVTLSDVNNTSLPFGDSDYDIISGTNIIGPVDDETEDVHVGETLIINVGHGVLVAYNWIAFPLTQEFTFSAADVLGITTDISMIFGCVTTRPDFSSFALNAVFDPDEGFDVGVLTWSGQKGSNSLTYAAATLGQLPASGPDIVDGSSNIGYFWNPPLGPFTITATPANPAERTTATITFTPDQGFYD